MIKNRVISTFLLLVLLITTMTSCGGFYAGSGNSQNNGGNGSNENENQDIVITSDYVASSSANFELFKTKKITPEKIGNSFTDGEYIYHTFKIGKIYNAPIYRDTSYYHTGLDQAVYQWKESTIFSKEYENMQKNCVSSAVSTTVKVSNESSATVSGSYKYGGLGLNASATTKNVFEVSTNASVSASATESFSQTISDKVERSKSRTVTISKDSPAGFYTYTIIANVDVYATLICDIDSNQIEYTYFTIPTDDWRGETFHFNNNSYFDEDEINKIEIFENDFAGYDLFDASKASKIPDVQNRVILTQTDTRKIVDTGAYGLEQEKKQTLLDLSAYEEYMNDDYVFIFNVTVSFEADKITDFFGSINYQEGHKQMFLYKEDPGHLSDSIDKTNPTNIRTMYGLLCEDEWTSDKGQDKEFVWKIVGEDCTDEMCIRYDAYGENDDTWYLESVIVTLTITMNSEI